MTRKDYELIARVFRATRPAAVCPADARGGLDKAMLAVANKAAGVHWRLVRDAMARALARENANFDVVRFCEACDA